MNKTQIMNFLIDEKPVEVILKIAKIKHMYLRISDKKIICSVPIFVSKKEINFFILDKLPRLLKKINTSYISLITKEYIYFKGEQYPIEIFPVFDKFDEKIEINPRGINIYATQTNWVKIYFQIKMWLKIKATEVIIPLVRTQEMVMDTSKHELFFNFSKKTLGSNHVNNNKISFTVWLVQLSRNKIDYLIVHELAHDFFPDHSKNFWEFVKRYCPNYIEIKKSIKIIE